MGESAGTPSGVPDQERVNQLCKLLEMSRDWFDERVIQNGAREFVFLKRKIQPRWRDRLRAQDSGIHIQRDYKRFYPAAEVAAHVVGFVDVDEQGAGRAGVGLR